MLCSQEEPKIDEKSNLADEIPLKLTENSVSHYYKKHQNCKQFIHDFYAYNFGIMIPENGIPECSEDSLMHEKHEVDLKRSEKYQNSVEFEVEFEHACGNKSQRKSPEVPENDIETLVSGDFGISDCDEIFCNAQNRERIHFYADNNESLRSQQESRNKNVDESVSDDSLRTNMPNVNHCHSNSMVLNQSQNTPKQSLTENCSYCATESIGLVGHTTSSLENRLSRLHDDCTCGNDNSSREHLTPSREIMRQVMRRVEIVPPGQRIAGYSSVENSPRAYHHGLMSHSFPTHPGHMQNNSRSDYISNRRKTKRQSRRRSIRNHSVCQENDTSPSRCYPTNNQNNAHVVESSWNLNPVYSSPLTIPRVQHLRHEEDPGTNSEATYSSCSSCQSISSVSSPEWDSTSPDTSSYNSECQDDEEIALALQAAEIASRNKARSRFKSSRDLLHKLFVCVSGVADQLQTNYASDLRNILKSVFDMNCSQIQVSETSNSASEPCSGEVQADSFLNESTYNNIENILEDDRTNHTSNNNSRDDDDRDGSSVDSAEEAVPDNSPTPSLVISDEGQENENNRELNIGILSGPPEWMPDELSSNCMACKVQFTILRRRHHCRNCGKIFCSRCSSNSIPLPRFGHLKPVRVCNQCFMYQLTNLVMQRQL
ncbi:Lateral signaling target protein 2-like protein, partial [Stegodyphus mimosarum]